MMDKLERLVAISEAIHADANGGNAHSQWLLKEAKCNCQQCQKVEAETTAREFKVCHVVITDDCRTHHITDSKAFETAINGLYDEYKKLCDRWPVGMNAKFHLILKLDRPIGESHERNAYEYAKELAVSIAKTHYPEPPEFEPLDDLMGILTQIDHMTTGLKRKE